MITELSFPLPPFLMQIHHRESYWLDLQMMILAKEKGTIRKAEHLVTEREEHG